jgi:hypothetical protein
MMLYPSLPIDLLAALPELPFPIYLQHDGRMVLYAQPGADLRTVLDRARAGLEVHIPTSDPADLQHFLVATLSRTLEPGSRPTAEQGRGAAAIATALLGPLFGPERRLDPDAFAAAQAAVDLTSGALAADPALARVVVGAGAPASATGSAGSDGRRYAARALDGLACAVTLATTLDPVEFGPDETALLDLGRGMAFRDLGLPRVAASLAERRTRSGPGGRLTAQGHPLIGVELLTAVLGSTPGWSDLVAGHHERLDGSGYPVDHRAEELSRSVRIVGLADLFASLIAPQVWGTVQTADEMAAVLRGAHRGSGPEMVSALVEILEAGRLLPLRRAGLTGATH